MYNYNVLSENEHDTFSFGQKIGNALKPGDIVTLDGNLGIGKTVFVKGMAVSLNVTEPVTSPSFTLINEYSGNYTLYHFDFYRIDSELELIELGYEDYFYSDGICVIEWAAKIDSVFPDTVIRVNFDFIGLKDILKRKINITCQRQIAL